MNDYAMKQSEFFKAFTAGGDPLRGSEEPLMLKVKDYPPEAAFAEEMPRHWQASALAPSCACPFMLSDEMQLPGPACCRTLCNAGIQQYCYLC